MLGVLEAGEVEFGFAFAVLKAVEVAPIHFPFWCREVGIVFYKRHLKIIVLGLLGRRHDLQIAEIPGAVLL